MKAAVVLLAILVVRADATLTDDAAAAKAQSNQLLSSLQDQITQEVNVAADTVNTQFGALETDLDGLRTGLVTIAPTLSGSDLTQIQTDIATVDGMKQNISDANAQFGATANNLNSQIEGFVQPFIEALGSAIANEIINLECFTNEVPNIIGNATAVATNAGDILSEGTAVLRQEVKKISSIIALTALSITALPVKLSKCLISLRPITCVTNLVSIKLSSMFKKIFYSLQRLKM